MAYDYGLWLASAKGTNAAPWVKQAMGYKPLAIVNN
jgi:hypothetical protein